MNERKSSSVHIVDEDFYDMATAMIIMFYQHIFPFLFFSPFIAHFCFLKSTRRYHTDRFVQCHFQSSILRLVSHGNACENFVSFFSLWHRQSTKLFPFECRRSAEREQKVKKKSMGLSFTCQLWHDHFTEFNEFNESRYFFIRCERTLEQRTKSSTNRIQKKTKRRKNSGETFEWH